MESIVKVRIEPSQTQETAPQAIKIPEVAEGINPNLPPEETQNFDKLEIWEGENNKKYVNEYFNTHNIAHEFIWKMPISEIDKFIRSEMETKEYEKTTKNYKEILAEIESKIGSEKLTLSQRLHKITGYIRALSKLYKARELRNKYLSSEIPSQEIL